MMLPRYWQQPVLWPLSKMARLWEPDVYQHTVRESQVHEKIKKGGKDVESTRTKP